MKRIFIIFFIFLISATGCQQKTEEKKSVEFIESNKKFDTVEYICGVDGLNGQYKSFNRDDAVEIIREDDYYYYIVDNYLELFIEKEYVRLSEQSNPEQYVAYCSNNTKIYTGISCQELLTTGQYNQQITVLDEFGEFAYVLIEDTYGYVHLNSISKNKYSSKQTSSDGEDISLRINQNNQNRVITMSDKNKGIILADETAAYFYQYKINENVSVIEELNDSYLAVYNGRVVKIAKGYLLDTDGNSDEPFEAYTRNNSNIYSDINKKQIIHTNGMNDVINVLYVVSDIAVISYDGNLYYMNASDISLTKFTVQTNQQWTDPVL